MKELALITGASSGIGYDMAIELASRSWDIIVVARREDQLNQLKSEIESKFQTKVYVWPMDVTIDSNIDELQAKIKKNKMFVSVLINNAGFGSSGYFHTLDMDREINMIDLNIKALVKLCHIFSQKMVENKRGNILNVGSVAAFQPGPGMSTYFASKAFVLHFSEGLNEELSKFGVKCSCLCPGTTKTEFFDVAQAMDLEASPIPSMKSSDVAKIAIEGIEQKRVVIIPGLFNQLMAFSIRLIPRWIVRKFVKFLLLRRANIE
ncbi:MAG: SDR family oxidoreductase [Candidatus Cloacimonetes bacterium]|nr:SDR family oxidoreductase [Candidatus Cloacimonadota bacterium]